MTDFIFQRIRICYVLILEHWKTIIHIKMTMELLLTKVKIDELFS